MTKIFSLHLSSELHKKLEKLAEDNQRSMSGHLRWLISNAAIKENIPTKTSEPGISFHGTEECNK